MPPEVIPQNGDAVRAIETLAKAAAGNYAPLVLAPPKYAVGLPEQVPALLQSGASPKIIGLRDELEKWRTAPERRKGKANVTTLVAFIGLTARHKDAHSALFARTQWPGPSLTSVIDYHQTDAVARFGEHRVVYEFPLTPEFQTWIKFNQKELGQAAFAEFIEENIADLSVALPGEADQFEKLFKTKFAVPTDLIELSRGLEIVADSRVKTVVRLQSGEAQIAFDTTHKGVNGEPLTVPGLFLLSLRVFVDGSEVRIPARLRYRLRDGAIFWAYSLYKWEDALRSRVVSDAAIAAQQTGLPLFEGAPEA